MLAASNLGAEYSRLFVTEYRTKLKYLIDTGSSISVYPVRYLNKKVKSESLKLFAANGSEIKTFGKIKLKLNLGLGYKFFWTFVIAEVTKPIIGVDFMHHYNLVIDVRNNKLIDGRTLRTVVGSRFSGELSKVTLVNEQTVYHKLLSRYPKLINPVLNSACNNTGIKHCIITHGPSVHSKPRRLAPDKLV